MRNKAKNALSLARPFSLGLAEAKIDKIWIGQGGKQVFFIKMFAGWEKVCNFANESPSDEILPRPSQPQKLAIFLKDMNKQKVIS